MLRSLLVGPSTWFVCPPPRGQRHSSYVRACAQTTATAAPDCNTSSSSSVASRRWSRVLAPQRVNPALAVAVGMMFHTQQQYSSNTVDITLSGNIMQFLLIILRLKFLYISGELGRRSSIMFGFLMPCWYSYSSHNNGYIFGQGDMTCLRSSKRSLKPSKTKYPLGKHPDNLMPSNAQWYDHSGTAPSKSPSRATNYKLAQTD